MAFHLSNRAVLFGSIFLGVLVAGGIFMRLIESGGTSLPTLLQGNLPVAERVSDTGQANATPNTSTQSFLQSVRDTFTDTQALDQAPSTQTVDNLAITITYTQSSALHLEITDVSRTNGRTTAEFYKPNGNPEAVYRLQLLGSSGEVAKDLPFTVSTSVIAEDASGGGVASVDSGSLYLVTEIPNVPITRLRLRSYTDEILDEQPVDIASLPIAASPWLHRLLGWLQRAVGYAPALAADGTFTIVVTNEPGAADSLDWTEYEARAIRTTEPWYTFRKSLEVIAVKNDDTQLSCEGVQIGIGDTLYPRCTSDGPVIGFVQRHVPQWDAIIVVTNINVTCTNCGSVRTGNPLPPIVAVDTKNTTGLMVHELAHAVGQMLDEYAYRFGGGGYRNEPDAINCYESKKECTAATQDLAGAKCSPGCWKVEQWRPANRIMHNIVQPSQFGPIERCIMGQAIGRAIGKEYDGCPAPLGSYPGGIR